MNYRIILNIIGKILVIFAALLLLPLIVGLIYHEDTYLSFIIPIACFLVLGLPFVLWKPKDKSIYAREGFVIVALSWVIISLIGSLPFVISKSIPNYIDAVFETVSGFTTTGASILGDVESLPRSILFWRSFSHWVGGMGVLVFVLAVLPNSDTGAIHLLRSESPGPTVDKLVSKMRFTARILYGIYLVLTAVEVIFLVCGGMPFFDSLLNSFSTAGTGGFAIKNASIAGYNSLYSEMVIAVFMFIFSINFNVYYLILTGHILKALKSEEFITYFCMIVVSMFVVAVNILPLYENSFGDAMRYSFFQVASISSTTGFVTADFDQWPALSKCVLIFLMTIGASAGSTGGGIKASRLVIMIKSTIADIKQMIHPRAVVTPRFEWEPIDKKVVTNTRVYFICWFALVGLGTILLSLDSFGNLLSNLIASITCISNTGPGLDLVGPTCNFSGYSYFSKIVLSVLMLAGRLEIFPILVLFAPSTWKKH